MGSREVKALSRICSVQKLYGRVQSGWKGTKMWRKIHWACYHVCQIQGSLLSTPEHYCYSLCSKGQRLEQRQALNQKAAICQLGGHTLGGLAYRTLMLPNMSIRGGLSRFQMEEYGKEQAAKNERIAGTQRAAGLCSCLLSGSIYVCYFHKSPFPKRRHICPDFLFPVIKKA